MWRYKERSIVTLTEAKEEADTIRDLLHEHWSGDCWLLIDISKIQSINREARKFFSSEEVHSAFKIQGLALVMGSPISTMIGNIYHKINKTKHPTKLFVDEDGARLWLDVQVDRQSSDS